MRRFADPQHCPDCGALIEPAMVVCAACALPLRTAEAEMLWRTLVAADASLARLRGEREQAVRRPSPVPHPVPGPERALPGAPRRQHPPAPEPGAAQPPAAPPHRRPVSVPVVLLGLGGLLLLVAGVVFVAVTWGRLSLGARTTVLLVVTAGAAVAAAFAVRRRLRLTAEVLALVTAGFLIIDLVAARAADLLGLAGVRDWVYLAACGALLTVLGAAASRSVRRHLPRLVGAEVVAVAGSAVTVAGLGRGWTGAESTYAALAVVGLGLVAGAWYVLAARVAAVGTAAVAVLMWLALLALTLPPVVEAGSVRDSWLSADGAGLLAAAGIAAVVARLPWRGRLVVVAVIAAGAASVVGGVWLWAPSADLVAAGVLVAAGIAALAAVAGRLGAQPWDRGLLAAVAVAVLGAGAAVLEVAVLAMQAVRSVASSPWSLQPGDPVRLPPDAGWTRQVDTGLPAWWAPVAAALLALAVIVALPRAARVGRPAGVAVVGSAAAVAGAAAVVTAEPALAWAVAVLGALGALGVVAGLWRSQGSGPGATLAGSGAALTTAGAVLAAGSRPVSGVSWPLVAVLAGVAAFLGRGAVRSAATAVAVAVTALAAAPWAAALGADVPLRAFVGAVVAATALLLGQLPPVRRDPALRAGLEAGGALTAVATVVLAVPSAWWLAATLTLTGAAVLAVALLSDDRRRLGWLGGLLLAAASWVRLADAGVDQVEAYTLPSAVALTVVGALAMRRDPRRPSLPTLGPGLALALGPSLVLSVEDPVSVRGLLTGLAGLTLVAVGVVLRWSAPLLLGATVTAVLAVRHLTPVAAGLPRWIVLGTAGVALVLVGATWERRRRDVRTAARYVAALR